MINEIGYGDREIFYRLGKEINIKFEVLYNLDSIISSAYDKIFGFYSDGCMVGFVHISKVYEVIDIVNVVVDEEFRRHGIASKLIEYVINLYDDVDKVMLEVNEMNIGARELYSKLGFVEINRRLKYYGNNDALIMERDV